MFALRSLCLAAACFCLSMPAAAVVHCVTDETQFRAALTATATSYGTVTDHDIRLTQRVFFNGASVFHAQLNAYTGSVSISGGWNTNCAFRGSDARTTILDAQGLSAVLRIDRNSSSGGANARSISVSNLTLRNGNASDWAVGLRISNYTGLIEVSDVILHGHRAHRSDPWYGAAMSLNSSFASIHLRNALLYDNGGHPALSHVMFDSSGSVNTDPSFIVTNTTILAAGQQALRMRGNNRFDLFNNVILGQVNLGWGNSQASPPVVRRVFNHMPAPVAESQLTIDLDTGNEIDDPQIDPSTFEPLPGSPTFNAGLGNPPGGQSLMDVYGRPRVAFTYIDRGALESQILPPLIFSNGFE